MKKSHITIALLVFWVIVSSACAQEYNGHTTDFISFARNFLTVMYPDSDGKNYFLTVEGWLRYDQENATFDRFSLYVGDAPKDSRPRYIGCMGAPLPVQLPTPPELGPRSSAPNSTADVHRLDCQPGPILPKQVLVGTFQFNVSGRLSSFTLGPPGIRQLDQRNKFAEFALSHPELSYPELVTALKKAGAKYGPDDKEQLVKDLPVSKLEPFLGKLQVVSVSSQPLSADRSNSEIWPLWEVRVRANHGGESLFYNLMFEQFEGELISLSAEKPPIQ